MEDLIVLRLALSLILRGRIGESAALIDVEELLRDELWVTGSLVGTKGGYICINTHVMVSVEKHQQGSSRGGHEEQPRISEAVVPKFAGTVHPPDILHGASLDTFSASIQRLQRRSGACSVRTEVGHVQHTLRSMKLDALLIRQSL